MGNTSSTKNIDLFHKVVLSKLDNSQCYTVDDIVGDVSNDTTTNTTNIAKDTYNLSYEKVYHTATKQTVANWFKNIGLNMLSSSKIKDFDTQWRNNTHSTTDLYDFFKESFANIDMFNESMTDELLSLLPQQLLKFILTKGFAAHLLEYDQETKSYYVDLLHMIKYDVRDGLMPYGAKMVLTELFEIKYIAIPFKPTVKESHYTSYTKYTILKNNEVCRMTTHCSEFKLAYNVFISSLVARVTIIDHAVHCHMINAGNMLYMTMQKMLDKKIVALLKPFLYKTQEVNENAFDILINKRGLLVRVFAFTPDALQLFIKDGIQKHRLRYKSLSDTIKLNNMKPRLTPFYKDALAYEQVIKDFVTKYVNKSNPTISNGFVRQYNKMIPGILKNNNDTVENLITVLTNHIFVVSFWHEHVGALHHYVMNPRLVKTKVHKTNSSAPYDSIQNSYQNINLALLTSTVKMPKMTDDLHKTQRPEYVSLMIEFVDNLKKLKFECKHLRPDLLECSVSL